MKYIILLIGLCNLVLLSACAILPEPDPTIAYEDILFAVPPVIIKRDENYYLKYRMRVLDNLNFRKVIMAKKDHDKGYYYFIGPISNSEYGNTIERPLAFDDFIDYAKSDSIYWLEPDGNETKIRIIEDDG